MKHIIFKAMVILEFFQDLESLVPFPWNGIRVKGHKGQKFAKQFLG
jgi:hypothetical protein